LFINPGLSPTAQPAPGMGRPVAGQAFDDAPELPDIGEPRENEDGSVDFIEPEQPEPHDVEHDANLAEALPDDVLASVAEQLVEGIDADKRSNAGMYELFEAGLKFVATKPGERIDTPFPGAIGVVHPLLTEALVRFQANARGEMLPASGPVRMQVNGDEQPDTEARAARKKRLAELLPHPKGRGLLPGLRPDAALARHLRLDVPQGLPGPSRRGQPVSRALTPLDLLVSYSATSLADERVTHIEPNVSRADLIKLQLKSWYRQVEIEQPAVGRDRGRAHQGRFRGREASDRLEDATYTLHHCHCLLDIPGLEHRDHDGEPTGLPLPYIVTVETETPHRVAHRSQLGGGRRRVQPARVLRSLQIHARPGLLRLGPDASAGIDRRRADRHAAAGVNNMVLKGHPGGMRVKGGAKSEQSRIVVGPGEFVEIDTGGMPIQQAIMPLPYADLPAAYTADRGRDARERPAARLIGDMAVGEGREDALPGTVIALIEQAKALEGSVIKRLHTAQRKELRLLADLFGADQDAVYPYIVGGKKGQALAADFADNEDIVPVSDPNIPTQTQRLAQAQAILTMARQPGSRHRRARCRDRVPPRHGQVRPGHRPPDAAARPGRSRPTP
jgi:hypothetical protein